MSTRQNGVNAVLWTTLIASLSLPAALAQSQQNTTRQQQPNERRNGAVVNSLRELYTIPRDTRSRALQPRTPRRTTAKVTRITGTDPDAPRPTREEMNRLGLQHYDAIHNSVSSVPVGGQDTGPTPPVPQQSGATGGGNKSDVATGTFPDVPVEMTNVYYPYPAYYHHYGQSRRERDWTNYRYFGGQPGLYGYGRRYGAYGLNDDPEAQAFRFGFLQGLDRGRFEKTASERESSLLTTHQTYLQRGLIQLRRGEYHDAVASFKLSAEANHGDPAARIYAAHSLFAIGRYQEAIKYLRRALELQPKVALLTYDVRDDYGTDEDFARHLAALEDALARSPNSVDRLLMLGYVSYYSGQRQDAFEPFSRADSLVRGGDAFARRFLDHCRPSDVALEEMRKR